LAAGGLEFAYAGRTSEMQNAHDDQAVLSATAAFSRAPRRGMVKLLRLGLYSKLDPTRHRAIIIVAGLDNVDQPAAFELLDATNAINELPSGSPDNPGPLQYARGAVLEQVSENLLRERLPAVLAEQLVGPLDGAHWKEGMSDPIDFVYPEEPHEFWDAKSDVHKIRSKHLNQFGQILGMAGSSARAGFLTLQPASALADWLEGFTGVECVVHAFTLENFESMAQTREGTRVR